MKQLQNLSISIQNLINETTQATSYIDKNVFQLIYQPSMLDTDIDAKGYCSHLKSIREYFTQIKSNEDIALVEKYFDEIPSLEEDDFDLFSKIPIPLWILIFILPLAVFVWLFYYYKLTQLADKLKTINSKLNTINFFLKNITIQSIA